MGERRLRVAELRRLALPTSEEERYEINGIGSDGGSCERRRVAKRTKTLGWIQASLLQVDLSALAAQSSNSQQRISRNNCHRKSDDRAFSFITTTPLLLPHTRIAPDGSPVPRSRFFNSRSPPLSLLSAFRVASCRSEKQKNISQRNTALHPIKAKVTRRRWRPQRSWPGGSKSHLLFSRHLEFCDVMRSRPHLDTSRP